VFEKIFSMYKLKERYGKLKDDADLIITLSRNEPQCPYRLLHILFLDMFSEGLAQLGDVVDLGMWLTGSINYFGKASKKPSQATLNYMTT